MIFYVMSHTRAGMLKIRFPSAELIYSAGRQRHYYYTILSVDCLNIASLETGSLPKFHVAETNNFNRLLSQNKYKTQYKRTNTQIL